MKEFKMSAASRRVLSGLKPGWQKVPVHVRGSHLAYLIKQGWIKHRQPGVSPGNAWRMWLSWGEIRMTSHGHVCLALATMEG